MSFICTLLINELYAQTIKHLTKDDAWKTVLYEVLKSDTLRVNAYVLKEPLGPKVTFKTIDTEETSPDYESWMFFIDDFPLESWEHPCRFVFVNSKTGEYQIYNRKKVPDLALFETLLIQNQVAEPQDFFKVAGQKTFSIPPSSSTAIHDYAVIISGGVDLYNNHVRYWNDCSAIYQTLVNIYGYDKSHIKVLMADGTNTAIDRNLDNGYYDSSPLDLDGDNLPDIQYAATKANLSLVFNNLANTITNEDNLFIFTMDHGGQVENKIAKLYLWNNESILDYEFAVLLNNIDAKTINICMGQCYSGGFIDDLQNPKRIIATACKYDEVSWAMSNSYDEFVYHWISAVNGSTPSGTAVNADYDNNNNISMAEAFRYARDNDTSSETPQYSATPYLTGQITSLYNPYIIGTKFVCDSSFYYIDNLSSDVTIEWHYTNHNSAPYPELIQDYPANNQCAIKNTYHYPVNTQLTADIKHFGTTVGSLSKNVITESNPSSFSYTYHQDACSYYGVHHPAISEVTVSNSSSPAQFVHQGCLVTVQSSWFANKEIRYFGATPDQWQRIGNTLYFSLPLNSGGIPFNIYVEGDGSCGQHLLFFSITANYSTVNADLEVNSSNNEMSFTLKPKVFDFENIQEVKQQKSIMGKWDVEIYSTNQMKKIHLGHADSNTYKININGWEPGVYLITAVIDGERITKKFTVKKRY